MSAFNDNPYGQTWEKDIDVTIDKFKELVHSSKTKSAAKRIRLFPKNYTTSDAYESEIIDFRLFNKAYIMLKNTHATNGLTYKIEGYIDQDLPKNIKADTPVAAGASSLPEEINVAFAYIKVSVKSTVASTPATLICLACLKT